MAIIGYIRINSQKQNLEHQICEIEQFAKDQKIKIDKLIREVASPRKSLNKHRLGKLSNELKAGDILIAHEISQLGSSLLEVMHILETCLNKNCQVWTIKENYRFGNNKYPKL